MNESAASWDLPLSRLVDGELSPAEYRALLLALDADPQGWRKCALAFLETQAMSGELGALRSEYLLPTAQPKPIPVSKASSWWGTVLAMAASFVVALPLGGWLLRQSDSPSGSPPQIAQQAAPLPKVSPTPMPKPRAADAPLGKVRLVTADGQVEVPYYNMANGAQYLFDQQAALSDSLVQSLEREGHIIRQSQAGVMPVQLDDGAQVYLPVESYLITPVSHRLIQ